MPKMTGRPGYRTMEMNRGSSAPCLACTPCVPLLCAWLIGVETEGLLDYQGRAGIIVVQWNLRPVIFGVEPSSSTVTQSLVPYSWNIRDIRLQFSAWRSDVYIYRNTRECQRGAQHKKRGGNLTRRPPAENSFRPPSPWYVLPPPLVHLS